MREYVVYRHGWDEVDQWRDHGLPQKMAVARLLADSAEEACRLAYRNVALTAPQHLTAEPADEVDAREQALNRTARAP
jgi:hypothetical protein